MIAADGTRVTASGLIATRDAVSQHAGQIPPTSALPGGYAIRKRGQGTVIADSRIYMHGDDMRYVDRGATARTGHLHVRTFHEERDQVSFLVADFRPAMLWGMRRAFRSVAAAEALSWLGWQAVARGGRVGLMAITSSEPVIVRTRGGTRGMLAVIGGLVRAHDAAMDSAQARAADHSFAADPPLDQALAGLQRIVPRGASVIIASALDSVGTDFDSVIGQLSQHRAPRFLLIEDQALHNLPAGHYPLHGPDGNRRAARFRKSGTARGLPESLANHDVARIDAGMPPRDAMAGVTI
ncbi:DUF58 domain-containing protein [Yoonia sediminilitoris]|uniref:Uncharacterized protein DUF58 n=1 Tax=Yoonia sediminilitoris TaxID=1286148 RepID=A0A2T6KS82_9RHOB|nr:DUF58 domain-containing protein [Yoonia sediminilitoris]PUB19426.1 uncharacterized protein DUF58 [Yoonia sediminilitoris]RCW99594.1 uncharacterized protein DUF58 [Yoonia sediminilitoris]